MSKKPALNMTGLLAEKGHGTPATDAPSRANARRDEPTKRRKREQTKPSSSEFVNLGFKVPREFRHHLRILAAQQDISVIEIMRRAVDLYKAQT
jgi:hypothetical protein